MNGQATKNILPIALSVKVLIGIKNVKGEGIMDLQTRNPHELKPHPISTALYGDNHIDDILESIREFGILTPLTITPENLIISGHRRWRSAITLELKQVPVEVKTYDNELAEKRGILEFNRQREKTFSQKMNEAELIKSIITEQANLREIAGKKIDPRDTCPQGRTRDKVAKEVGISSGRTLDRAGKIWNKAQSGDEQAKELVKEIDTGDKTINRAFTELAIAEKRKTIDTTANPLPEGIFDVLYADPPWQYEFSETITRAVENQYPTLSLQEIKDLEIPSAESSVLLLWATAPKLTEALEVMLAWGFTYRTNAVWDKEIIGMGYWFRGQHELLLVGVKGNYPAPSPENRISSVIRERRSNHSAKPEKVYDIIEKMFPHGKYLELFSRCKRERWESWGNQIG